MKFSIFSCTIAIFFGEDSSLQIIFLKNRLFVFLLLSYNKFLYILDISPLLDISIMSSSYLNELVFIFIMVSFDILEGRLFKFWRSPI